MVARVRRAVVQMVITTRGSWVGILVGWVVGVGGYKGAEKDSHEEVVYVGLSSCIL